MRSAVLDLALWVVRSARRLVPERRRQEWVREWEAEIHYAWRMGREFSGRGLPPLRIRLRILFRAFTSIRDAAWLRRREWTMTTTWTDFRVAARSLARRPGFASAIVGMLAVAIGVNAAIFSLLDGVLLKELPYRNPGELVRIWHRAPGFGSGIPRFEISDGYFMLYRDENRTFQDMGAWSESFMTLTGMGDPERISVGRATPDLFTALGLPPALGRLFLEEEGLAGAEPVALLAYETWITRFGTDPEVLGRSVTLNGVSHRIVGVAPEQLTAPLAEPRIWVPFTLELAQTRATSFSYSAIGRLRAGVDLEAAGRDLTRVLFTTPEVWPEELSLEALERAQMSTYAVPLKEDLVGDSRETLWLLQGAVALVLLIAWANASNLVAVRSERRDREVAVRRALGAGGVRIFGHFLGEAGILGGVACGLGLALAWVTLRILVVLGPGSLPRLGEVSLGGRALLFAGGLATISVLLLAAIPGLRKGPAVVQGLREGGRGHRGGRPRHAVRGALVVGQVALSLVLLVGSGLLFRSFQELRRVDPGFRPEGVMTMQLTVNRSQYGTEEEARSYWRQVVSRVRETSGVESAALVGRLPLEQRGGYWSVWAEDKPVEPGEVPEPRMLKTVSTGYFRTMGIGVSEGRSFSRSDLAAPTSVVVVSRSLARSFWPGESAVGKRVRIGSPDWRTVIGVADDVREEGLSEPAPSAVYGLGEPEAVDWQTWSMFLVARTTQTPVALLDPLRRAVWSVNPGVPITSVRSMDEVVDESTADTAFSMLLMATAAVVALFLGVVGLYAVVSYVVVGRSAEIGVRMALGAEARQVRVMVLRQGMGLATVGVALGVGASVLGGRIVESFLFQVSPRDPVTLVVVPLLLLVVAALASLLPAQRAARIDPSDALRLE